VRNCLTDEGRPLGVGLQERTSNHLPAAVDKSHGRERERKRLGEIGSVCRAYTIAEMLAMTHGFDDYDWKADRIAVRGEAGHLTHRVKCGSHIAHTIGREMPEKGTES
jgi:hypothetical protein